MSVLPKHIFFGQFGLDGTHRKKMRCLVAAGALMSPLPSKAATACNNGAQNQPGSLNQALQLVHLGLVCGCLSIGHFLALLLVLNQMALGIFHYNYSK